MARLGAGLEAAGIAALLAGLALGAGLGDHVGMRLEMALGGAGFLSFIAGRIVAAKQGAPVADGSDARG